ncbi:unnamed protein product [Caenorhabditis brenneri]
MTIIECEICHLQYNQSDVTPRILTSCGHTICQRCVTKLSTDGRTITCPFDKRQVTIFTSRFGSDGVIGLHKNLAVLDLTRKDKQELEKKSETDPCFENPSHEAVFYCEQCDVALCDSCFTYVHKSKTHCTHQKIKVSEKPLKLPKCPNHPHNTAEFYCTDHKCTNPTKIMCQTCVLFDQHKSHKYDFLMEKLLENEQVLKKAVEAQKMFQEKKEMMTKIANQILESYEVTGEEFKNAVKVISEQFDTKKKEAICELTRFANDKKEKEMELKKEVERRCIKMEEFDKLIETLKITNDLQCKDKIIDWFERETPKADRSIEPRCLKDHEFIVSDMKLQIIDKPNLSLQHIVETFKKDMDQKYTHLQMASLECKVCLQEYSNQVEDLTPRMLTCGHTICEKCAEQILDGEEVACPFDRKITNVDGGEIKALSKNYTLLEILEERQPVSKYLMIKWKLKTRKTKFHVAKIRIIRRFSTVRDVNLTYVTNAQQECTHQNHSVDTREFQFRRSQTVLRNVFSIRNIM